MDACQVEGCARHVELVAALERSLDKAVSFFLAWSMAQGYPVLHPWLRGGLIRTPPRW